MSGPVENVPDVSFELSNVAGQIMLVRRGLSDLWETYASTLAEYDRSLLTGAESCLENLHTQV